jgi:hypothetical protein
MDDLIIPVSQPLDPLGGLRWFPVNEDEGFHTCHVEFTSWMDSHA